MKRYSTAELRKLEVVNLCDGCRIGYASDFEFEADACGGKILSLIIPGNCGFFGWGKEDDLVIPWRCVECIGSDTILVRLEPEEYSCCLCPHPGVWKRRGKGNDGKM